MNASTPGAADQDGLSGTVTYRSAAGRVPVQAALIIGLSVSVGGISDRSLLLAASHYSGVDRRLAHRIRRLSR